MDSLTPGSAAPFSERYVISWAPWMLGRKESKREKGLFGFFSMEEPHCKRDPLLREVSFCPNFQRRLGMSCGGPHAPPPKIALKVVRVCGGCGRLHGSRRDGVGEHIYGSQTSLDSQKLKTAVPEYRDVLSCTYLLRGRLNKEIQEVQLFPQAFLPS